MPVWLTAGLRLGVQSREICPVTTGSLSALPEPRKTMENPYSSFLLRRATPEQHSLRAFLVHAATGITMRVWTTTLRVWTLLMNIGSTCACVRVCALVCWNPTFQLFELFSLLAAAAAAAAAVRIMFESHTVPQALKLSTLWQPRYNSSRTGLGLVDHYLLLSCLF